MRSICVYTSTRAEYGLLNNLLKQIHGSPNLKLQLLVSGAHLALNQGYTVEEILENGFEPAECVDIALVDDSPKGICRSMGIGLSKYGNFFDEHDPDLLLLLGDRFETFCCAAAAHASGVPIAHIHGGELTQGAIDDAFRHSITKMAHFHFPCCEEYRKRIIQMGEQPDHVYNVGALGVENIREIVPMDRKTLEQSIGFKLDRPFFLITFHPVTLEKDSFIEQFIELLAVLDHFPDHKFIFTGANADSGGRELNKIQNDYALKHPDQCFVIHSLGYLRYLSAMKLCETVIGNSSSGIIEAPALRVPTINIGDRQKGRVKTISVVDCHPDKESIFKALNTIFEKSFQSGLSTMEIPFEKSDTSQRIKEILGTVDLTSVLKKDFFDIK